MQASDDIIWKVINHGHCSKRKKQFGHNFCRDPFNVSGFCNRRNCPLANSRYATVRDDNGRLCLYVKTAERAHLPSKMWERIRLRGSFSEALKQIDKELAYWPHHMRNKCKARFIRLTQIQIRQQKIALKPARELVRRHKKVERREMVRMKKAERAAMLESQIKKELFSRLVKGTYPTEAVNLDKGLQYLLQHPEKEQELESEQEVEMENEMEVEDEGADEEPQTVEYVAGDYDSDEEIDDAMDDEEDSDEEEDSKKNDIEDMVNARMRAADARRRKSAEDRAALDRKRRQTIRSAFMERPRIEIEYEHETETVPEQTNTN